MVKRIGQLNCSGFDASNISQYKASLQSPIQIVPIKLIVVEGTPLPELTRSINPEIERVFRLMGLSLTTALAAQIGLDIMAKAAVMRSRSWKGQLKGLMVDSITRRRPKYGNFHRYDKVH